MPNALSLVLSRRFWFVLIGVAVVAYGLTILIYVISLTDLGLRSAFATTIKGTPHVFALGPEGETPRPGDRVLKVGDIPIRVWPELLNAPTQVLDELEKLGESHQQLPEWARLVRRDEERSEIPLTYSELQRLLIVDDSVSLAHARPLVRVLFERTEADGPKLFTAWCELGPLSFGELFPSILWFFLKTLLFTVGFLVFWKQPDDDAAAQFYLLCAVTLGAYMGGYHWSRIATQPVLLVVFIVCAALLPASSLHFYLLYPRKKERYLRHPRLTVACIYALPALVLCVLLGMYGHLLYARRTGDVEAVAGGLNALRNFILHGSFAISSLLYLGSITALLHSFFTVPDQTERNQVRCILAGFLAALVPIGWSLYVAVFWPDAFADGAATWPMFLASVCISAAFAISVTRYRLKELDKIIQSGMGYFVISFLAGLTYYGLLFVGALLFNQVIAGPSLGAALTASTTALVLLFALDRARGRLQKALDRRFSRNKSQLDRTLQQMSQAVAQLVDPPALAQRLLHATTELLGAPSGAVYLRAGEPPSFRLAASVGQAPPLDELPADYPLVEAALRGAALLPDGAGGVPGPAERQLCFLGGGVAQPLTHDGRLLALLVLGPRDAPYGADDCHLLASFARLTVLALDSAAGHRTIEVLNRELQAKVDKIAEQQRRILVLQTQLTRQNGADGLANGDTEPAVAEPAPPVETPPGGIVGSGPVVRQLHGLVRKVAATDAVVLLRGESGTGKELLARAVHETSARAGRPYVKVHCAALSANLLESELFGHIKGAFTGAHRDKVGRFELADGGTLFLDEIGDVSLEVQTKLLRVLQEKTIERVGSSEPVRVDVRVIAATHQDLEGLIRQGKFREDLFYRLNVFPIRVPPLRERREDVPELVLHFVQQSARRCRRAVQAVDDEALSALKAYHWPGNVRELENVIERAVVIAEGEVIAPRELPFEVLRGVPEVDPERTVESPRAVSGWRAERDLQERERLLRALAAADGNKAEAARALGLARSTLVSRLKKLGLD